jgi:phosphatidate cytidylyltransferase
MHLKRWISGLVLAPILILFTLSAPPWLFTLFILALIALGLKEFYALAVPEISPREKTAGILLCLLPPLALFSPEPRCFHAAVVLLGFFLFIRALCGPDPFARRVDRAGKQLLGFLYVAVFLAQFILLRKFPSGPLWILFTLTAVFAGDTAAFYVGRAFGRKKLAPAISPGKTVEGGYGAAAGSVAGALLFKALFFPQVPFFHALMLGLGAGVFGQLGDLWESVLKRSAQVKDSGTLIPGHGGLLDRIDSVLFAGPFVYYYAWIMGLGN